MSLKKILFQFDSDAHASVFDAVVAVDSGVDQLCQYSRVDAESVRDLVHGTMFTRGPQELKNTAIFVGGSNVETGELLLERIQSCFFGPMRVSVLFDANGCNTTAAAAVLAAEKHVPLANDVTAVILAGTGPVGLRAARLLARAGVHVRIASRNLQRAQSACSKIRLQVPQALVEPCQTSNELEISQAVKGAGIIIAAGSAGVELLSSQTWSVCDAAKVMIDLNAVPPAGIAGIQVMDKAVERSGVTCYGAIGVGGTKMKIHKAAIAQLFQANDQILDAEAVFEIGRRLTRPS